MPRTSTPLPFAASFAALVAVLAPGIARAQQPLQPLPPPAAQAPPGQYQPPPGQYQPPPGPYQAPPPGYGQPYPSQGYGQQPYPPPGQYQPPPPGYYPPQQQPYYYPPPSPPPPRPAPAPVEYEPPDPPTHAPKFSLWMGPRLSYMGFGFNWYENPDGNPETTGNLVGNGVATELDLGARISHRYIPYIFWDHGFLGAGHRFDGMNASAATDYYGIGFRFLSGDVDSVAFLTEIAVGMRSVTMKNGAQKYSMSGLEFFKLGLGAEIRVMTLFSIEPVLSISSGRMSDTEGTIDFAPNQGDGSTKPPFTGNGNVRTALPYVMLSLGVGVHFDVFGK